jgi:hypothetical protein
MNDRIAKLYDECIVLENGQDYVAGELDVAKFVNLVESEVFLEGYYAGLSDCLQNGLQWALNWLEDQEIDEK